MALQITIVDPINGATSNYWRLLDIQINIDYQTGLLILGGYTSREWRDAGGPGRYNAVRRIAVDSVGYAALFAAAASLNLGITVGGAAYSLIKTKRRIIPDAVLNLDGSFDWQGANYAPEQIQIIQGQVSLPSEFASAIDV